MAKISTNHRIDCNLLTRCLLYAIIFPVVFHFLVICVDCTKAGQEFDFSEIWKWFPSFQNYGDLMIFLSIPAAVSVHESNYRKADINTSLLVIIFSFIACFGTILSSGPYLDLHLKERLYIDSPVVLYGFLPSFTMINSQIRNKVYTFFKCLTFSFILLFSYYFFLFDLL